MPLPNIVVVSLASVVFNIVAVVVVWIVVVFIVVDVSVFCLSEQVSPE